MSYYIMIQPNNIIPINTVLKAAKQVKEMQPFSVNGISFKRTSTMSVIIKHGTTCVACKQTALYFQYSDNTDSPRTNNKVLRLVFDHTDPENRSKSFMTKDHILAKANGGLNIIDNYQPMCLNCNRQKSDRDDANFVPTWMHSKNRPPLRNIKPIQWYTPFISWIKSFKKTPTPLPIIIEQPIIISPTVKAPTKRIITSTKLGNKTSNKISTANVLIYKAYIRWYTQVYHKNMSITNWKSYIRPIILEHIKKDCEDFDSPAFRIAFEELVKEVNGQPTKTKKGKPFAQLRPAKYFSKF